jgi:hypothetical protein
MRSEGVVSGLTVNRRNLVVLRVKFGFVRLSNKTGEFERQIALECP